MPTPPRCFPTPWSVETDACFIVRDANGQALAYVYFEEEPGRRSAAHLLTHDEAPDRRQPRQAAGVAASVLSIGRVEDRRGSLGHLATPRFPSPLIEPDVPISGIRLSDWFHRRAHDGAVNGRRSRRKRPRSP